MVTVSETAAIKLASLIEESGFKTPFVRVSVKGGGCSGLSYDLSFDIEQQPSDTLAESMGLSVDQLVKMNAKQEELNKLRIDDPALYAKYTANLDTIDKTNESLSEEYQLQQPDYQMY